MATDHRSELRKVRTFPSLVKYLRDEMGWPIENGTDFEDLTFDYTPEELGIEAKNAAKIQEIKRLRPLSPTQPWGIFFVKFEPKRLPVVALRRILGQVALKKRASANKSERQAWAADDLLFVSNHGEGEGRHIAFAHFSTPANDRDLPTLKVLGWDNRDTPLHLDAVSEELTTQLAWPEDGSDTEAWRTRWRAAFSLRHREVITTSKELSLRLARLARDIRDRIRAALSIETEKGPLTQLMKAFQAALVHDLDDVGFADMYAQTIAYGLLSARIADPTKKTADDFAAHMRTNPFLRELMETFLHVGGRRGKSGGPGIDFDELGVSEVVELLDHAKMDAVVRDFGDRNPQEDPVIHFYELFLTEYDATRRMQRGVFYTPRPVVSYIVRTIDELLRLEFGLADGLADTSTWEEVLGARDDLELPDGCAASDPFVQILDPATGTGTFLVETIDVIHTTMTGKWRSKGHSQKQVAALWNGYVTEDLLPRLHGYELMMAPYAIGHMKIGLKLYETGYRFGGLERARLYLTNALGEAQDWDGSLAFAVPALAHEAEAVSDVKRRSFFTVIMGNPPYSVTSMNKNDYIDRLMGDYKKHVRGEQGLVALADDYLKFIRLSQELLRRSGCGIWGMITNRGYLAGIIHRGVRKELTLQYQPLYVADLHGDTNIGEAPPSGSANENVFDIQQGVAISIGVAPASRSSPNVSHVDCWGTRTEKYQALQTASPVSSAWKSLQPEQPEWLFVPFDDAHISEYQAYPSLADLMPANSCGVKTHRDRLVIDTSRERLIERIHDVATEPDIDVLRARYGVKDTAHWTLMDAKAKIGESEVAAHVRRITYRPFDIRWIYYNPAIIEKGDSKYPTLRHMLHHNRAILASRIQAKGAWSAIHATRFLAEMKTAEASRSCTVFPLYLSDDAEGETGGTLGFEQLPCNLSGEAVSALLRGIEAETPGAGMSVGADEIFNYTYAVLHSCGYRERYASFLTRDFPRVPPPARIALLQDLAGIGAELLSLHLLESDVQHDLSYVGPEQPEVGRVGWSEGCVWLDARKTLAREGHRATSPGTMGFHNVPKTAWDFDIGGYQVCHKWLKDRKGQRLSEEDLNHYGRVVGAIEETIRLMSDIEEVISRHGGWPAAFAGVGSVVGAMRTSMVAERPQNLRPSS